MHIADEGCAPRCLLAQCVLTFRSSIGVVTEYRFCGFAPFLVQHTFEPSLSWPPHGQTISTWGMMPIQCFKRVNVPSTATAFGTDPFVARSADEVQSAPLPTCDIPSAIPAFALAHAPRIRPRGCGAEGQGTKDNSKVPRQKSTCEEKRRLRLRDRSTRLLTQVA
jgi:hypothetical protein